ncbi:MAG: GIY-YIG nuclease family protein [Endozoicomonadaceae bacterium]|nr:GIY-YIG nuclease family protein [Endozoicomonadaceae bacterium]
MSEWYIYIIRCAKGTLYTGITTDVERRFREHSSGNKGARYLRGRAPLKLVFHSVLPSRVEALKLEAKIKKLTHPHKEALIAGKVVMDELTGQDTKRRN